MELSIFMNPWNICPHLILTLLVRVAGNKADPEPLLNMVRKRMPLGPLPANLYQALLTLWDDWKHYSFDPKYTLREQLGEMIGIIEPGLMRPDEPWAGQALETVNAL